MSIREEALALHRRGWSVVPMRMETKVPAVRWKALQTERATERQLAGWWKPESGWGLGVIFGPISGDLASRDFDDLASYQHWAAIHTALAGILPTVETRRGRHVYFQCDQGKLAELRERLGKPHGTGAIACGNGELRAGPGCYSVVPPSIHPSGHVYRWLIPLPAGQLPRLDPVEAGFVPMELLDKPAPMLDREGQSERRGTEAIKKGGVADLVNLPLETRQAILEAIPASTGQRNRQVFELARALKGLPALADADPRELRPLVVIWFRLGRERGVIATPDLDLTIVDFYTSWKNIRFPKGTEPIQAIIDRARANPLPKAAALVEGDTAKMLVAICRELQRSAGPNPFFLACRTAGRILGVDHAKANRYLKLLEIERVLAIVERGQRGGGKATRYRYLGD